MFTASRRVRNKSSPAILSVSSLAIAVAEPGREEG